ncbi:MAG TPA: M67 family metallopeptidase [bacterium]
MLELSKAVRDEMVAHCRAEYPKEACGILGGRSGRAAQVYTMTNLDASPISYAMDPKEQLRVMRRLRAAGQDMVAIYHSHTASDAYPSPVDASLAVYSEASYVLVSLKTVSEPRVASYRIEDGRITEEPLVVSG